MTQFFYGLLNLMEQPWFVQTTWLVGLLLMFLMAATTGWRMKLLSILLKLVCVISITAICMFHQTLWPAAIYAGVVILVSLGLLFSKDQVA